MTSYCIWCGIPFSYYSSPEHAGRQSCKESDSGYHEFSYFPCLSRLLSKRVKNTRHESLLAHRRRQRPNTI